MNGLGERIRKRRNELHLTNQKIADALGYDKHTVEQWMGGRYVPRTPDIPLLCEVLECSPNYLLGWEEE